MIENRSRPTRATHTYQISHGFAEADFLNMEAVQEH
ncbi:hypothetical protein L284_21145 [Novosphingobium lindaniclasticum LE124]|uniref:Uncharacterized protein n=1 Tax=Novosphingobium lindaniclasticum LE124 TaxID=1096930 RepID=T0H8T0_9SPHN|nr:hypothetical protein L284_21145 [Novosphingobium lindaniclasticum LE124]